MHQNPYSASSLQPSVQQGLEPLRGRKWRKQYFLCRYHRNFKYSLGISPCQWSTFISTVPSSATVKPRIKSMFTRGVMCACVLWHVWKSTNYIRNQSFTSALFKSRSIVCCFLWKCGWPTSFQPFSCLYLATCYRNDWITNPVHPANFGPGFSTKVLKLAEVFYS